IARCIASRSGAKSVPSPLFAKVTLPESKWIASEKVLEVYSPHVLNQVAGYAKHVLGRDGVTVAFRGQTTNYPKMIPSLYRGPTPLKHAGTSNRDRQLKAYIDSVRLSNAF